jgi:hypothetical protein
MSREQLIVGGVVVLAGLSFAVYKQAQKDESLGHPVEAAVEQPTVAAPDDVDKISITNGDKPTIVLQKVAGAAGAAAGDAGADGGAGDARWELTAPVKAEASAQAVKDLVANLTALKVDSKLHLKLDDDVRKDKQLDPAHAVHVVAYKGADKKIDESFGKSGSAGQLMIASAQPDAVWAVKGYSQYLYTKEPKDFRDKEILKFDEASVAQVTIHGPSGELSFTKGDRWAGTADHKPIPRFDEEKVKDMLRAYRSLNADDFGDGKSPADTGLDKPEATVTVQLKDGAGSFELAIGKTSTGTSHWAKRADRDQVYQITSYAADWATVGESKFQSAADAGAPKPGTAKK